MGLSYNEEVEAENSNNSTSYAATREGVGIWTKNNPVCHTHPTTVPTDPHQLWAHRWTKDLSLSFVTVLLGTNPSCQTDPDQLTPSENEVRPLRSSSKLFAEHQLLRHFLLWIQNYFPIRGRNLETVDFPEHPISHSNSESTFLESKRQNQRS